ncbi:MULTISPECIES: MafI family immunity protein [Enterobacter]|uniref:MafI family immunity protein n=1 Tax=Enterobacter vonholyi TaxID=2797505 RepID=A0ABU6E1T0_9ENTR|nr:MULTISPECIES: MafI family immunity protein [Enterobacter]MCK7259896.1 MafI family immunity protein [Enterobacter asburiae]QBN11741.1 MafI family immunity protein [Enterobacter cloacae complex sp.]MCM7620960.1 MafI family immunity protein [Enterobacter vonholyi]MEB5980979.1 MafI family immunity protein [Enterobacter vonholyi]MEB6410180.1 MafI family immunity protein [Enterobacter vonholyi]
MDINDKIRLLGEGLKDRLDPSLVDFALDYIGFSENVLAFETLCDHIADFDVVISRDEYTQVLKIANDLGLEIDSRYTYINPEK